MFSLVFNDYACFRLDQFDEFVNILQEKIYKFQMICAIGNKKNYRDRYVRSV